jgi:hypothetical protein
VKICTLLRGIRDLSTCASSVMRGTQITANYARADEMTDSQLREIESEARGAAPSLPA